MPDAGVPFVCVGRTVRANHAVGPRDAGQVVARHSNGAAQIDVLEVGITQVSVRQVGVLELNVAHSVRNERCAREVNTVPRQAGQTAGVLVQPWSWRRGAGIQRGPGWSLRTSGTLSPYGAVGAGGTLRVPRNLRGGRNARWSRGANLGQLPGLQTGVVGACPARPRSHSSSNAYGDRDTDDEYIDRHCNGLRSHSIPPRLSARLA